MFNRLLNREINAELFAAFIFIIVSGFYIIIKYDFVRLVDVLFLWMFPASIMIFLTLLIVKIIEQTNEKRIKRRRYVSWGNN